MMILNPQQIADEAAPAAAPRTKRHRRHANPFTIRQPKAPLDDMALFGRTAPLVLDVGCGSGLFTAALAAQRPEDNVLGVEIRQHLVDEVNARSQNSGLANLKGVLANANLQLIDMLGQHKVSLVCLNFPDPWYKKRHHKRRVLTRPWLDALRPKLQKGAEIHTMTDYLPLAEAMREVLEDAPYFTSKSADKTWLPCSSTGLFSERELTHQGRQEPIYRLAYVFCESI